jgi:hypothetical protein
MKKLFITLVAAIALTSCKDNNESHVVVKDYQPSTVSVTPEVANLGDNLNLQALGELVKNSTSAQDIEDKLNQQGSINNLDLNNDGNVDYIKVTEYGEGNQKGFSFTVDLPNNESQEIATIEVQKGSDGAQMNIQGNHQLYGNNHYYQSHYSLSDLMIMHYLFTYHRPYYSPYHYGYYPRYYRSYRSAPYSSYRTRMATTTRTTRITRSTPSTTTTTRSISSPNANKASSTVTARAKSMAAPTSSQKSFSTTSSARQKPTTSGFGNKNRSTTSSSSKPRSSGSSWSGSSSSSSRRSSGSSWGSSSSSRSSGSRSSGSRSSGSRSSGGRRSDARFKTNIKPLKNSLEAIGKLDGVTYDWRINEFPNEKFPDVKQNGLIAQDVEKVFPNLVETRADGYKTVDYVMLVPSLIEAVKELKTITDKQAKEIKDLKETLKDEASKREKLVKGLNSL